MSMKHLKAADILIIAILLIAAAYPLFSEREGAAFAEVSTSDGLFRYSLDEERKLTFTGPLGETIISITDGTVRIVDSPCPGKTCTHGSINEGGQMLICLPNQVSVKITGGEGGVDAAAY